MDPTTRAHVLLAKFSPAKALAASQQVLHVLGQYHFTVTNDAVRRGELRPLRNPNAFEQEILIA